MGWSGPCPQRLRISLRQTVTGRVSVRSPLFPGPFFEKSLKIGKGMSAVRAECALSGVGAYKDHEKLFLILHHLRQYLLDYCPTETPTL